MVAVILGIAVLFAWVSFCLVWINRDNAARADRIARATRPRHGARIIPPAHVHNRLGDN